jgi:hypothetical protein
LELLLQGILCHCKLIFQLIKAGAIGELTVIRVSRLLVGVPHSRTVDQHV